MVLELVQDERMDHMDHMDHMVDKLGHMVDSTALVLDKEPEQALEQGLGLWMLNFFN